MGSRLAREQTGLPLEKDLFWVAARESAFSFITEKIS